MHQPKIPENYAKLLKNMKAWLASLKLGIAYKLGICNPYRFPTHEATWKFKTENKD